MVQIWTCKVCACALFSFYAHHYSRFFQISSKNYEGILIPNIRETLFKLPIIEWFHSRNLRIFYVMFFLEVEFLIVIKLYKKMPLYQHFIWTKKDTLQHFQIRENRTCRFIFSVFDLMGGFQLEFVSMYNPGYKSHDLFF